MENTNNLNFSEQELLVCAGSSDVISAIDLNNLTKNLKETRLDTKFGVN